MRIPIVHIVPTAFVAILLAGCSASHQTEFTSATRDHAIDFARHQLAQTVAGFGDSTLYPRYTDEKGKWKTVPQRDWTSGFFPGCLWYMQNLHSDDAIKTAAKRWTEGLINQQYLTQTHDIGFIINTSYGNGCRLGKDSAYLPVILQAARSLMTRYNSKIGCIKSWDNRKWGYPVIIDNMMNIELLFWASRNGGTQDMYDAAVSHAKKTMQNHFRPDGSTYHVVDYDTVTGNVLSRETHQGYANESVWARGQAWAIYGFTMAYRYTGDSTFLAAAENAANWFIDHLPADHVPYWDFKAPNIPDEKKDASAAAIAASALYELQSMEYQRPEISGAGLGEKYLGAANAMMSTLCSPGYLAEGTSSQGILNHAVGNYPKNSEIDVALIYGDYYFLEALSRSRDFSGPFHTINESHPPVKK